MDLRSETMLLLGDLVGFPTVTSESNLDLIAYVADRLEPLATDVELTYDETGQKANLLATIGPAIDGGVILSGHTDVVPAEETDWTGAPFVAIRREQNIYGRGTADMKGFIACAIAMAKAFAAAPLQRPVHIAATFDEEVGCKGAPVLIDGLARRGIKPAAAIVGEPTGMNVVIAHKGMHEYTTTLTGVEGHGSAPDRAVNAVHYGALYVAKLLDLGTELEDRAPANSPYDPPHTTISVGTISGGMARNVVAGECTIQWEMRPVNRSDTEFVLSELESFEQRMRAEMQSVFPDPSLNTVTEGAVGGLEGVEDSYAVRLVSELVDGSKREVVAFGTEAGIYQAAGIPSVVCGPGAIEVAHRPDEHISLEQLESCLDMMEGLVEKLSDD